MSDPTNAERQARHRARQQAKRIAFEAELRARIAELAAENARLRAGGVPSDDDIPRESDDDRLPADYELVWEEGTGQFGDDIVYTGRLVDLNADHYWISLTDDDGGDESKGYSVTFICEADDSIEPLGKNLTVEAAQELAERHLAERDVTEDEDTEWDELIAERDELLAELDRRSENFELLLKKAKHYAGLVDTYAPAIARDMFKGKKLPPLREIYRKLDPWMTDEKFEELARSDRAKHEAAKAQPVRRRDKVAKD